MEGWKHAGGLWVEEMAEERWPTIFFVCFVSFVVQLLSVVWWCNSSLGVVVVETIAKPEEEKDSRGAAEDAEEFKGFAGRWIGPRRSRG